ncbi:MAG: HAD hydrolase-like protein, partial [SAR324 cluster bacterium]|nr:HAD hydrolase-like protein [SAR324 cluster bacterium]
MNTETKRNFEAVVFDLDGTLLNTLDDLAASMNRVLESHQFPS